MHGSIGDLYDTELYDKGSSKSGKVALTIETQKKLPLTLHTMLQLFDQEMLPKSIQV